MYTLVRCYGGSGQNSNLLISYSEFDSVYKRRYHHKWGQTVPLQTLTSATGELTLVFAAQNYVIAYLLKRIKNCFLTAKLFHTILRHDKLFNYRQQCARLRLGQNRVVLPALDLLTERRWRDSFFFHLISTLLFSSVNNLSERPNNISGKIIITKFCFQRCLHLPFPLQSLRQNMLPRLHFCHKKIHRCHHCRKVTFWKEKEIWQITDS